MNRFVKTALAIAVAGSAANAGTGDSEWAVLDSEISGLASSLQPPQDGMGWSALIRGVFTQSSDDIATAGGDDTSGFGFNDLDLAFWGSQGPYSWRISADIEFNESGLVHDVDNDLGVEDGYIRWNCGGYFDTTLGQFKPHVSRSNSVDPEHLLFIDRSALGSAFDFWDQGIGASGAWEALNWYAALMNASNGHTRDHFYLARLEWMIGAGAGLYEGAMGSSDTLNATAGISWLHDDSIGDVSGDGDHDTNAWLADFHGSVGNIGFGGEIASLDEDFLAATDEDFSNIFSPLSFLPFADDSTPWNAYASYLISPEFEVGGRIESLDNNEILGAAGPDHTLLSVVVNWNRNGAGKWQAQWTDIDADSNNPDGSIIEIGYTIGASR